MLNLLVFCCKFVGEKLYRSWTLFPTIILSVAFLTADVLQKTEQTQIFTGKKVLLLTKQTPSYSAKQPAKRITVQRKKRK